MQLHRADRMPPTLHQIKSEHTRARLLDAAVQVLESKGHGQLSIHEVARAAGMTAGAVQHHFASKAALMMQVITRLVEDLETSSDFWPPPHWTIRRRADHFVRQAWLRLYGQPRFAVAWSAYLAARDDEHMVAHIIEQRSQLSQRLQAHMSRSFPEMCQGRQAGARIQFVLSSLRGMGLLAPFAPEGAIAAQLQVLSQYIQSFTPPEDTSP